MSQNPVILMWNPENITVNVEYNELVVRTITGAANEAASAPSGAKKFAVKKVVYTWREDLYVLVQCTPDLSTSDCKQCLQAAIANLPVCCNNKQGGRVLFPSCNFRFENYSFYNETAVVAPPPTPVVLPPTSTGPAPDGKGSWRKKNLDCNRRNSIGYCWSTNVELLHLRYVEKEESEKREITKQPSDSIT
ncbi:unnamed protein product [Dovyalis caffra]|uniref:Gnk2-homologous domain-containing protein n=1 Tax=Dovyalis caffra TaxID=77055 RepID=A0AAV1SHM0_9ROSI|nr:unnamed protein product [Dovyalis caffra]